MRIGPGTGLRPGGEVIGDDGGSLAGVDAVLGVPLLIFHSRVAVHEVV